MMHKCWSTIFCLFGVFGLAVGQIVYSQHSTFNKKTADLAADKDPSTCAQTGFDYTPWWRMDYGPGVVKTVTGVDITGVANGFQIRVGNETDEFGAMDGAIDKNPLCALYAEGIPGPDPTFQSVPCRRAQTGRFITIHVVDTVGWPQLTLCDVRPILSI